MSLAELLQYRHCAYRAQDYWTLSPAADPGEDAAKLTGWQPPEWQG